MPEELVVETVVLTPGEVLGVVVGGLAVPAGEGPLGDGATGLGVLTVGVGACDLGAGALVPAALTPGDEVAAGVVLLTVVTPAVVVAGFTPTGDGARQDGSDPGAVGLDGVLAGDGVCDLSVPVGRTVEDEVVAVAVDGVVDLTDGVELELVDAGLTPTGDGVLQDGRDPGAAGLTGVPTGEGVRDLGRGAASGVLTDGVVVTVLVTLVLDVVEAPGGLERPFVETVETDGL